MTLTKINSAFWDEHYQANDLGWDLGEVSPPIKKYIDGLADRNIRILIPGCGNAYEADYLLKQGFTDITVVDISPTLVKKLQERYSNKKDIKIICNDFFKYKGEYDLILEQTFFCALNPELRTSYRDRIYDLLSAKGKLAGLLFDRIFEKVGPPFGGTKDEYKKLFAGKFEFIIFDKCYNSFPKRKDTELFIELTKKKYKGNVFDKKFINQKN